LGVEVRANDFGKEKALETDTIHPGLAVAAVEYFYKNLFEK